MKIFSKITASHYVLPSQTLTNEDLFERFEPKKIKGISKLSGIYERRIAPKNVTSVDLGAESACRMIKSCNIDKDSIDMVVMATQTPDYSLPASAFVIHDKLALNPTCGAFDISLGCAAFPYVVSVVNGLIASGQCSKVLVIIADTISKLINNKDRSLVPLHGDGAATFLFEKSDENEGIEFVEIGSESSGWKHLIVPDGGMRNPLSETSYIEKTDENGITTTNSNLQMNGAAVFHFSISTIPEAIKETLKKHNLDISRYSKILLHQANKMMLENIYNSIGATSEQKYYFMEKIGNLSAASTPILLAKALRDTVITSNTNILTASFGVGLTWGITSIKFCDKLPTHSNESTEF